MGLTTVVGCHLDRAGCLLQKRPGLFALHDALLVVSIRNAGVDFHGVRCQGLVTAHVGGQDFQIHLDLLRGGPGMFFRIRGYDSDRIAKLEHLLFAKNRAVPSVALVGRESDEAGNRVLAFHVLPGDDLDHAGHLFRFRGIDAFDVGVRHLGLGQSQTQSALRHAQGKVGAEIPGTGDLCHGRRAHKIASDHGDRAFLGIENLFGLNLAAHNPGGIHHRVDEGLVTGAAAQVAIPLEPVANLLPGRVIVVVQQNLGGHDEARCTNTALRAAVSHPGDL